MNIFVAKLSRNVTSEDLQQLFSPFGEVLSSKVITDRFTQMSKGFGFVEMADEESAMQAINTLNETQFMERTIIVKPAHPRENEPEKRSHTLVKRSEKAPQEEDHGYSGGSEEPTQSASDSDEMNISG